MWEYVNLLIASFGVIEKRVASLKIIKKSIRKF